MGMLILQATTCDVKAATVYESDGIIYDEGYIIVGESHISLTVDAYSKVVDENGTIPGLKDVTFHIAKDDSVSVADNGDDNTFIMSGNLFLYLKAIAMLMERLSIVKNISTVMEEESTELLLAKFMKS